MEAVLEPLIHSPKLIIYCRELDELVVKEQKNDDNFTPQWMNSKKLSSVIVQSPVKIEHEFVSGNLYVLLRSYVMHHQLGYVGPEKMLISLTPE